jgi:hypothetical protein
MADVKQAAEWMRGGKKVRRKSWPNRTFFLYQEKDHFVTDSTSNRPYDEFDVDDILADDWEAEENTNG